MKCNQLNHHLNQLLYSCKISFTNSNEDLLSSLNIRTHRPLHITKEVIISNLLHLMSFVVFSMKSNSLYLYRIEDMSYDCTSYKYPLICLMTKHLENKCCTYTSS
jgi:hypothetical protein